MGSENESQLNTAVLLQRYQQGDQDAAKALFDRYSDRLLRIVGSRLRRQLSPRLDPDDVVQSAYRSFFRIAADGHVDLDQSGDLWRLLVGITMNKLRMRTRYHYADKRSPVREHKDDPDRSGSRTVDHLVDHNPEEEVMLADEIDRLIQQMNPIHREILLLLLQGEDMSAVAEKSKRTQRTVRRVLEKAEFILKARFSELGESS